MYIVISTIYSSGYSGIPRLELNVFGLFDSEKAAQAFIKEHQDLGDQLTVHKVQIA
jgi:hypothetical protein